MATAQIAPPKKILTSKFTPFTSSPDPTGVYLTAAFKSAIFKSGYAVEHRQGLAMILGDPGHGKSTLMRYLYSRYSATPGYLCSFTPNPNFKSDYALLKKIGVDFGIPPQRSMLAQQSVFEDWVVDRYAEDINIVVFIDEAQRMDSSQLELVRTILNFETNIDKSTQIVMAGNCDLRDRILQKKNRALMSRVFAPCLMSAMTRDEMVGMLAIRCDREAISWPFMDEALDLAYAWSKGTPRAILQACEFAYAQASSAGRKMVSGSIMANVLSGLDFHQQEEPMEINSRGKR